MEEKVFKIKEVNRGFDRLVYQAKNDSDQIVYYCFQDDFGITFYRCSDCDYFEPQRKIKLRNNNILKMFEIPSGDSEIENKVRQYLTNEII
jgi:hypothetical protein